ncbi:hypothetical protein Psfp_02417 [Pelotomaculum sp. FP]|uniref:hypothetical protein n=1 Tax=Pelotomaculum sp. FP TaxID=261474 RepID=UPI001066F372|nr:hypothetical protein [Pelotomaculum sp. FP]TEB15098.1 hypothetical protein Psfp_02417 [Pelotomaculum sp. FP]
MRSKRLDPAKVYPAKKLKLTVVAIAAALLIGSFYTITWASYIYSAVMKTYIATAEGDFYFTSDLLTDAADVPVYHITHDWHTAATIGFELRNYENQLNVSDRQITYTAAASPSGSSVSGAIDPAGPVGQSQAVSLTVPAPANTGAPLEVLVTAASSYPYAKTLWGRFIISPAVSYTVAENTGSPVAALKITLAQSAQQARAVTITWQDGAAPDMTNPIVLNATSIDLANKTLTTSLNTAALYELVFFKDSAASDYTGVTVTGA